MTHLLAELTRIEAGEHVPNATVILPSAAIEQHGPHLPILTDTCIVEAVSQRVATAEWGERLLAVCVRDVAAAIEEFHHTAGAWFA